ncbi:MAG: hypothetical protein AAB457_03500 [Patescibacteria group bacterium]
MISDISHEDVQPLRLNTFWRRGRTLDGKITSAVIVEEEVERRFNERVMRLVGIMIQYSGDRKTIGLTTEEEELLKIAKEIFLSSTGVNPEDFLAAAYDSDVPIEDIRR